MAATDVDNRIKDSQDRINALYLRAGAPATHQRGLLPETFEEMQILFNELSTACEELRQQNEALEDTQNQLLIEHQRYYDLFNFIPDSYFLTDASGVIAEANRSALLLLEISPQFIKGKTLISFISNEDRENFRNVLSSLRNESGQGQWLFKLKPRQNKPFTVQVSGACVRSSIGEITGNTLADPRNSGVQRFGSAKSGHSAYLALSTLILETRHASCLDWRFK